MKNLTILVPSVVAGILVSAMVLAAPLASDLKTPPAQAPNRALAYHLAMGT